MAPEDKLAKKKGLPPDGKLRVIVTEGCSGSTFVIKRTRDILDAHGYSVDFGRIEAYRQEVNKKYDEAKKFLPNTATHAETVAHATLMLNDDSFQAGLVTLFKWQREKLNILLEKAGPENVKVATMVRGNPLDRLICQIKDCFPRGLAIGYPVFAGNGSRADLCFDRRYGEYGKTLAHFDSRKLSEMIHRLQREKRSIEQKKKEFGAVTYEELMAFEFTDDEHVFKASMKAWHSLVSPLPRIRRSSKYFQANSQL